MLVFGWGVGFSTLYLTLTLGSALVLDYLQMIKKPNTIQFYSLVVHISNKAYLGVLRSPAPSITADAKNPPTNVSDCPDRAGAVAYSKK